jgi:hypothetical protein
MRRISKQLAALGLSALATAFMTAGVGSAYAQGFVALDGNTWGECPELVVKSNQVSGGCLIEDMHGEFVVAPSTYAWRFAGSYDIRMGPDGHAYTVNHQIGSTTYTGFDDCSDAGKTVPWAMTPGEFESPTSVQVCLESSWSGEIKETVPLDAAIGPNNDLLGVTQVGVGKPGGIWNFDFENEGDTDEVMFVEL